VCYSNFWDLVYLLYKNLYLCLSLLLTLKSNGLKIIYYKIGNKINDLVDSKNDWRYLYEAATHPLQELTSTEDQRSLTSWKQIMWGGGVKDMEEKV
jgi:hypothetical protein